MFSLPSAISCPEQSFMVCKHVFSDWGQCCVILCCRVCAEALDGVEARPIGILSELGGAPHPWTAGPGESEELLSNTHSWGVYFDCVLKERLPKPRADIAAELYRAGESDIGKIAAGDGQVCLKSGMYYVRGVVHRRGRRPFLLVRRGVLARFPYAPEGFPLYV